MNFILFCSNDSLLNPEILAGMLALREVITGVFETLVALEEFQVPPFQDGYERRLLTRFIGRISMIGSGQKSALTPAQPDSRLRWTAMDIGSSNQDPAAG